MKKKYIILYTLLLTSCSIISPYYLDLSEKKRNLYQVNAFEKQAVNENDVKVYSINSDDIKSVVGHTNSKTLVVFFTYWCANSVEKLPKLMDKLNTVQGVDCYLITPEDWVFEESYRKYSSVHLDSSNVFMLDVNKYGEKRNPHYRMHKFIAELCDNCDEVSGFPSVIIFDEKGEIVYAYRDVEMDSVFGVLGER